MEALFDPQDPMGLKNWSASGIVSEMKNCSVSDQKKPRSSLPPPIFFPFPSILTPGAVSVDELLLSTMFWQFLALFLPERSPNELRRGQTYSSFLSEYVRPGAHFPPEMHGAFGMCNTDLLFLFDVVWPPSELPRATWTQKKVDLHFEQLAALILFLRSNDRQQELGARFARSQPTIHKWIFELIPRFLERLTRWFSSIHPFIARSVSMEELLQLPVWREFPDIRVLVDTTIHPRIRPTELQSHYYSFHRAKHGLISLIWTDILGHILAIECGFAALLSEAEIVRCMCFHFVYAFLMTVSCLYSVWCLSSRFSSCSACS
jgi:hypothetical protein